MGIILKAEHISKQYRLGLVGSGTIRDDLKRAWYALRGKENPLLKIGEVNDRSSKASGDYVWALRDIDFEVKPGEVLGIIGKNGAGKSTLLKILSRVTAPTTGIIKSRGRIASLLEVGTGFHPELTGRENIYLNGAILGMTKKEIGSKLDEIIDFSGCERYIDTPTKRYSSGMTVRLAFAVAAHLEPEILVVDEVLAVGDAEFQKKAIGKMQDISSGEGRTVLFVSHNMAAIRNLCTRGILLDKGNIVYEGSQNQVVEHYLAKNNKMSTSSYNSKKVSKNIITTIDIVDQNLNMQSVFGFNQSVCFLVKGTVSNYKSKKAALGFRVKNKDGHVIFSSERFISEFEVFDETFEILIKLPKSRLLPNIYFLTVGYHEPNQQVFSSLIDVVSFEIEETGSEFYRYKGVDFGSVVLDCNWTSILK